MKKSNRYIKKLLDIHEVNMYVDQWLLNMEDDLKLINYEIEKTGKIEGFGIEQFIKDDNYEL